MPFPTLLLIAWVSVTAGVAVLPPDLTTKSSGEPPLIFHYAEESMPSRPYRVTDFRKVLQRVQSSVAPGSENEGGKSRSGDMIPASKLDMSQNMDGDGHSGTAVSHSADLGDPSLQETRNGNGTAEYERDQSRYGAGVEDDLETGTHAKNPEVVSWGSKRENVLSIKGNDLRVQNSAIEPLLNKNLSTSWNFSSVSADELTDIHKTEISYTNPIIKDEEKVKSVHSSQDDHHLQPNLKLTPSNYSEDGEQNTTESYWEDLNSRHGNSAIGGTIPKDASANLEGTTKAHQRYKSLSVPLSRQNDTDKNVAHSDMQQDGTYDIVTVVDGILLDASETSNDIDKLKNEGIMRKGEFLKSFPPTTVAAVTTPDSHMNDPPFRGPNVPQEIDHFYREKDKAKIDYRSPNPIVELPSFQSLNIGKEWKQARQLWGVAWDCHCYVVGSLFAAISFYSFISLLRVKTFITLLSTVYYVLINSILFLICLLRAFYLMYDPYNLTGKYSNVTARVLLKVTLPSLCSCFCLLALALLNFTKTQFLTTRLQRLSVLLVAITIIFSLFLSSEILISTLDGSIFILLVCYLVIISCASLSSICYFLIFKKLHHRALRKQGEMIRVTFTKMHIDGAQLPKKLPKPTLSLAVRLVLVCAIIQILLCFLSPYAMVFLQGLFPGIKVYKPWLWWGYQLSCRILELMMSATLSFVATQPLKHFEIGDNRFCSILMWFPCSSFADCFHKGEIVDFEAHSDNYANPQGLRSSEFSRVASSRRLQTNSLPTFRTPLTEVDTNLPLRTLPCTGRHTNHTSALSLLSYYRSKRTLSLSTNECLEDLERTLCSQTVSSSDGRNSLRPASMLYKDNGFIRFRRETDPEQPMEMSDEDDLNQEEADTSLEDADSTKVNVGSSFRSLMEGDVVQNTLSPFFQIGYKRRFRKMSRVSIETTDYSADVSSDQLSNVVNLRNGLSTSALDFTTRKYGSTCSSESAANSFDVTFFLNNSNSSPEMQTSPTSTTPASLNVCSAYRSETEDDKTSSVEGHEVMLRSVSPIVKRASSGRLSLNLNLHAAAGASHSSGHVNVACGTEDITPDSAVYLDLHLSRENSMSPRMPQKSLHANLNLPHQLSPEDSYTKSTDGIAPLTPETSSGSPTASLTSQSLNELRTSNSYAVPRIRKNSRGLLCKLRGSTFSLNASFYGYEPLEHVETKTFHKQMVNRRKFERSSSDCRPLSEGQLEKSPRMVPLEEFWQRDSTSGSGHLGDSGLLGDCGLALVDVASQTEDIEINDCPHKNGKSVTKDLIDIESQSLIPMHLVDRKI